MTTNTSGLSNVYCACWSDCTSCWLALPVTVGGPKRLHIIWATHGLQPQTHTRTLETRYAATHNIHNTQRCSFLSESHGITNLMPTYLRDFTPASILSAFTTRLKTYHHTALSVRITGFVLQFLTLEDGTDRLSRNVGITTTCCVIAQKSAILEDVLVCIQTGRLGSWLNQRIYGPKCLCGLFYEPLDT